MIGFDCPKSEDTDCGSRLGLQLTSRSETTSARQPTSPSRFLFRPGNRIKPSPMHPRPQKPFSRAEAKNSLLTCCAALRKRNTSLAADSMRPQLRGAASSGTPADSHDGPVPLHYRVLAAQRRFPLRAKGRVPSCPEVASDGINRLACPKAQDWCWGHRACSWVVRRARGGQGDGVAMTKGLN